MNGPTAFVIGILVGVALLAGLGPMAAPGLVMWIGYILYRLTIGRSNLSNRPDSAFALLMGTTVSLELLGPAHFGNATLFAASALCLSELGIRSFQFTSPFLRFGAALILSYMLLDILLFPGTRTLSHVLIMALPAALALVISYLSYASNNRSYENV